MLYRAAIVTLAVLLSRLRNLVLHHDILPNKSVKIQDGIHQQSTNGERRQAKTPSLLKEVDQAAGLLKLADSGSEKRQHGLGVHTKTAKRRSLESKTS